MATNPLISIMRQPKLFIQLPSKGEFWEDGSILQSQTGEYPVYSMTARDELMLKIPDALLNGQAVVEVIQHCMPNIKNAWCVPTIDLDIILIAIRIATYGEKMDVPVTAMGITENYQIDLRNILNQLLNHISWTQCVPIDLTTTAYVKPLTYKQLTESSLKTFETQRVLNIAADTEMSDIEKAKQFKEAFDQLSKVSVDMIVNSIYKIESIAGIATEHEHISEYIENCDSSVFSKIKLHYETLSKQNQIPYLKVTPSKDMIDAGVTDSQLEVPLSFDPANFFA